MCTYLVIMSLSDYLTVCLCAFTWQNIDQAGGPETFLTLFCLNLNITVTLM